MKPVLLCAFAVLLTCPLGAQRASRGCPAIAADSAAGSAPVYLACQVDREAKPRGIAPRPDWTPSQGEVRDGACFRAEFQFVVDTVGMPEVATIHDGSATSANFQQAVRDAIPRLRYSPAMRDGMPVRQLVSYKQLVGIRAMSSSSPSGRPTTSRPPRC